MHLVRKRRDAMRHTHELDRYSGLHAVLQPVAELDVLPIRIARPGALYWPVPRADVRSLVLDADPEPHGVTLGLAALLLAGLTALAALLLMLG
jgi:hypothetical protein